MIEQAKCCETAAKNVQEQMKNCHTGVALIAQEQKVIVYEHYCPLLANKTQILL